MPIYRPAIELMGRLIPVIYLFHGSIQTDTHWLDLGLADDRG